MPKTVPWDAADIIDSPEAVHAYLEAAMELAAEEGDPSVITQALSAIARSRGMTRIAEAAGVSRPGLYKALGEDGDPRLSTFFGVIEALGLHLTVATPKAA